MTYKNFRFNIIIRVFLILVLTNLLVFVVTQKAMLFVPLAIVLCLIAVVLNLIHYIERRTKDLTHLLLAIRQGAFTESFHYKQQGKQQGALSDALNNVMRQFAVLNEEKELQYQYLRALNENIGVAILSFDQAGSLLMMNPAAKRLLALPSLPGIEAFKQIDFNLYEAIKRLRAGERVVVKAFIAEESLQLNVQMKEIVLQGKRVQILLLQNLNHELENKEIEAWQQLVRVLTHEIMNSVTPIVSLTNAIQSILIHPDGTPKDINSLNEENIEDVFSSLSTVAARSKGLLNFVSAYKEYAKPLELHSAAIDIAKLVVRTIDLLKPDIQKFNIQIKENFQGTAIYAQADGTLLEQVLINLFKNAIEAVAHDGTGVISVDIKIHGNDRYTISIADNGAGMEQETMSRIFIPFFTTKPKGTGIGLSLSRQIMKLHNGNIRVQSTLNMGSTFTIEWAARNTLS